MNALTRRRFPKTSLAASAALGASQLLHSPGLSRRSQAKAGGTFESSPGFQAWDFGPHDQQASEGRQVSANLKTRRPLATKLLAATLLPLLISATALSQDAAPQPLRAGMIGLDTSHVPAFTKLFNNPKAAGDLAGIRVVAGYPGGTDMPASRDRVAKFTEQLRGMGVEIVPTVPALLEKVDVVLLESVDGRIHLQEATPVIKAGKPLFIDKPAAGSLADVIAIYDLARKYKVPCFSSSSLRFSGSTQELKTNTTLGKIIGAVTWGPCSYQEGTPDMFFYGIHGIEALFTLMGTGCETVTRVQTPDADVLTGVWSDGRVGTYRGLRRYKEEFGAVAFGTKGIVPATRPDGYEELCQEIGKFFRTRQPPVTAEETIAIFTFMEAADQSKRQGGKPISLKEVLATARAEAASKL